MKKQIVTMLALLVLLSGSAAAQKKDASSKLVTREIKIAAPFSKLVVEGNVDVLIFEDATTVADVKGKQKTVECVKFTQKDGMLTITASRVNGKNPIVYLPVQHLAEIEAWKDATVTGTTVLQSTDLTLSLNDDCKISVTTIGKIKLLEGPETRMVVLKNSSNPLNDDSL